MSNDLQRTEKWFNDRKGKVTASECYLLMQNRKEPMNERELAEYKLANPKSRTTTKEVPFSQGTLTYLNERVAESYIPEALYMTYLQDMKRESAAMKWGTEMEESAREAYMDATGYTVIDSEFIPLAGYKAFAGGSPDGIVEGGDTLFEKGIIEIKCPYNPAIHLRHYLYRTADDLKNDDVQYYYQCQMNMLVADADWCDFVSWCPWQPDISLKILRIPRDAQAIATLTQRIELAKQYIMQKRAEADELIHNK